MPISTVPSNSAWNDVIPGSSEKDPRARIEEHWYEVAMQIAYDHDTCTDLADCTAGDPRCLINYIPANWRAVPDYGPEPSPYPCTELAMDNGKMIFTPAPWIWRCREFGCWGIDPETGRHFQAFPCGRFGWRPALGGVALGGVALFPTGSYNDHCPGYVKTAQRAESRACEADLLLSGGRI